MSNTGFWRKRSLRVRDDMRTDAAELTLRQSFYPLSLVTILFFLWGFSYGLLDTLNKHFQNTLGIDKSRSAGLQAAYFGAYPVASLGHAAWILRHYGYRAVFTWGLCLYGIGALVAIPAIKAKSFGGFCACIFIIGNGLGSLETAANPYITVCGPPKYSEIRINVSQAFNAIGTVIAPVIGSYIFFSFDEQEALQNVQWVYTAIAAFVLLLAVVFFFSNIPEITDADMAYQVEMTETAETAETDRPFRKQYRLFHAAFAQFCYTGAQVALAGYFINYATETRKNTDSALGSQLLAGAQGAFSIGRLAGAILMRFFKPRIVFGVHMTLCVISIIPTITTRGNRGIAMLFVTFFFESVCFPTIIALGMRGLGRHTKRGSGWLVAGVAGGACVPPLMGAVADLHDMALSMVVPFAFFVAAWTYAFAVNLLPYYRVPVDSCTETAVGLESTEATQDEEKGRVEDHAETVPERGNGKT